ncbi:uncharacterized protein G2W53_024907 [Senna tora]|uniref:DUF7950 domain-containing protein n=1 Tax=Senna tora TaxID=362788 RepID=A0A834TEC4_9FABA|nr:uncharacterized protein G2W53_024907 [Senna tora]
MDGGDLSNYHLPARAGAGASDRTIVNRIMLRFRPIAPKPAAGGSASGAPVTENKSAVFLSGKRAKRKYVRVRRKSGCRRQNNNNDNSNKSREAESEDAVVTLQLLPEKSEAAGGGSISGAGSSWCKNVDLDVRSEKVEIPGNPESGWERGQVEGGERSRRVVESWVTVESVGDTCMIDVGGLGSTDAEKVKNLERDTCPGFVSDGWGKVRWVNEAYKRMVSGEEGRESPEEITVRLKVKDNVVYYSYRAFTCGVRLQYTWQKEKWTKTVPCDVWRLDCGGFAWRLDIKAALSLGL